MADSIMDNAAIPIQENLHSSHIIYCQHPPSELIDSTNYTSNFAKLKCIHFIGIDPTDMFRVAVYINNTITFC